MQIMGAEESVEKKATVSITNDSTLSISSVSCLLLLSIFRIANTHKMAHVFKS